MEQITVAELIEALQAMPQDAKVETEGCDCIGDVIGVEQFQSERKESAGETIVLIQNRSAYWR